MDFKKHINKVLYTFLLIPIVGISLFVFFVHTSSAFNLNDQKKEQAASSELPSAEFKAEPSFLVRKGGEVSLFAQFQNYAGEGNEINQLLYNWCVDNTPLNSALAGSTDEFFENPGGSYNVRNQYGVLSGGSSSCKISQVFDPNLYVRTFSNVDGANLNELSKNFFDRSGGNIDPNHAKKVVEVATLDFIDTFKEIDDGVRAEIGNFNSLSQQEKDALIARITAAGYGEAFGYWLFKTQFSYYALNAQVRDDVTITRSVASDDDIDGDGLSDAWELRYFGKYSGKTLPKAEPDIPAELSFIPKVILEIMGFNVKPKTLPTINPGAVDSSGNFDPSGSYLTFLQAISPDDDPDADGFIFGENYGRCGRDFFGDRSEDDRQRKLFTGQPCWRAAPLGTFIQPAFISVLAQYAPAGFSFFSGGLGTRYLPGPVTELWQVGVPYVKIQAKNGQNQGPFGKYKDNTYKIDDGNFTNAEEYVAGTDPLTADTDADGIPDGYDFAGLQQTSIPIKIQKDDDYVVDLHLFGASQKGSLIRGEAAFDGDFKKNITPYRFWRTDVENQTLKVGGGLPLQTRLAYSPYPVTIQQKGSSNNQGSGSVSVEAATVGAESIEGSLFYTWYLDGLMLSADSTEIGSTKNSSGNPIANPLAFLQSLQSKSDYGEEGVKAGKASKLLTPSGYGKNIFEFDMSYGKDIWKRITKKNNSSTPELGPCAVRNVAVDVIDDQTARTSHASIAIPIGDSVNFTDVFVANVDESKDDLLEAFNLGDQQVRNDFIRDVVKFPSSVDRSNASAVSEALQKQNFLKDDAYKTSFSQIDPIKGYRRGDLVSVRADLNKIGSQCEDGYYERLVYKWYLDDLLLEDISGKGKQTALIAMSNIGVDVRDDEDLSSHILSLEVVDPETNTVFAATSREYRVIAPYVDLVGSGGAIVANVSVGGLSSGASVYQVQQGADVKVTAQPRYFRPLPEGSGGLGFAYNWQKDGSSVDVECTNSGSVVDAGACIVQGSLPVNETSYQFKIDDDSDATHEILLSIATSQSSNFALDPSSKQQGDGSVIFAVDPPEGVGAISGNIETGALFGFVPARYAQSFNATFALGGFALLAVLAGYLYQSKRLGNS